MLEYYQVKASTGNNSLAMNTDKQSTNAGILPPPMWSMLVDKIMVNVTNIRGYDGDIVLICRSMRNTLYSTIQSKLLVTGAKGRSTVLVKPRLL